MPWVEECHVTKHLSRLRGANSLEIRSSSHSLYFSLNMSHNGPKHAIEAIRDARNI